jgi:hypothetical protein
MMEVKWINTAAPNLLIYPPLMVDKFGILEE